MPARVPYFPPGSKLPGTKYEVVKQLGAGGMGVVFQVVKQPQIQGVLKLMSSDLAVHGEFRSRFFDEVRVLAQLDHPNIVRVFDYDSLSDGTPFYVMEVLQGQTLRDVMSIMGSLPPRVAFEIARQLCEALHCAHTNVVPVVHRDIKPENIFLHSPKHGEPLVKLIDFGVVAVADRKHDGTFVGTWRYAAPEQIEGKAPTAATDLYAVGLVLYEMLCGRGPFDQYETGPLVSRAHLAEIPPPVSEFAPWVPPSIVALIQSALQKDPRHRPKDAYAFAERLFELEHAASGSLSDPTREGPSSVGPLRKVLTEVSSAGPASKDLPSAGRLHQGPTIAGVGEARAAEVTAPPDEDALLAGLGARPERLDPPVEKRAPARAKTPVMHVVQVPPAPTETDTFASQESDARRRKPTGSKIGVVAGAFGVLAVLLDGGAIAWTRARGAAPTPASANVASASPPAATSVSPPAATSVSPPAATSAPPPPPASAPAEAPVVSAAPPASAPPTSTTVKPRPTTAPKPRPSSTPAPTSTIRDDMQRGI